jgi:co-chaperonin GroES (HSP10)
MKLIKDIFLVKLNKLVEDTVTVNGVEMYLDSSYDPMAFARQYGEVLITPEKLSSKYMDVQVGDRIYFHHFVADQKNKLIEDEDGNFILQVNANQIYCAVRDGEIIMQNFWCFVEKKTEPEENFKTKSGIFLKATVEVEDLRGYLRHGNQEIIDYGAKIGDEVVFTENSEYSMNVEGKELLRMRNIDILAVIEK